VPELVAPVAAARPQSPVTAKLDPDVERARSAGGPIDKASYDCQCGFRFSAAVSTTVCCPHCGSGQAW
jgi:hypothetical protein